VRLKMRRSLFSSAALLALAAGAAVRADGEPSVRGLLGKTELVLLAVVLDESPAPGGSWHRLQVEEVYWPARLEDPLGPTLRVFAHGAGVPEGAVLVPGQEVVLGASRLAPPGGPALGPLERRLRDGFHPDFAGERPAVASADGIVPAGGDRELLESVVALVRAVRQPDLDPEARADALLDAAARPEPFIREEAVRRLGDVPLVLSPGAAARARQLFEAELAGPRSPGVLSAHLDLLEAQAPSADGPLLSRLLEDAPREDIAARAAQVLAARGRAEDFQALASRFRPSGPARRIRILHALAARGGEEHLWVFAEALGGRDPRVRGAALEELAVHPAPAAAALLESAEEAEDPELRQAARQAAEGAAAAPRGEPGAPAKTGVLKQLLEGARRRLEETGAREERP